MPSDKWIKQGSLWKRKSQSGKTYLSGVIDFGDGVKHQISVWLNTKGDNPKRPDFIIYDNTRTDDAPKPEADNDGFGSFAETSDADDNIPF